ncbi:hypothetical protein [Mycolicibacterium phlei]|uniref:hypothetical protein n=1 Tax=Mycolicibacterium phlei TaxID=1771 RepID=UPI000AE27763|nr:hypothetical protein [Mycolicibacterium phlei]
MSNLVWTIPVAALLVVQVIGSSQRLFTQQARTSFSTPSRRTPNNSATCAKARTPSDGSVP